MGYVLAISNNKGGVGKSTTTANLAHALANRKKRVLIVDADSQCNLTSTFVSASRPGNSLLELLDGDGVAPETCIIASPDYERLHVLPNKPDSAALEPALARRGDYGWHLLRDRLRDYAVNNFDFTLIDCPPNLGLFSIQAMIASDFILAPVEAGSRLTNSTHKFNTLTRQSNPAVELDCWMRQFDGQTRQPNSRGWTMPSGNWPKARCSTGPDSPSRTTCSWAFQSLVKTGCYRQPAGDVSPAILAERAEQEKLRLLLEEQKKTEQLRFEAWRGLFEDPSPR